MVKRERIAGACRATKQAMFDPVIRNHRLVATEDALPSRKWFGANRTGAGVFIPCEPGQAGPMHLSR